MELTLRENLDQVASYLKKLAVQVQVIYLSQTIKELKYTAENNIQYAMAATGWLRKDR